MSTLKEIERKFLVKKQIPNLSLGVNIIQAYIFSADNKELRVRIKENICCLTIKISLEDGSREEFEYEIPVQEGLKLIRIGSPKHPIVKTRYTTVFKHKKWEIDYFKEENEGLIMAEVELDNLDEAIILPEWIGEEVTDNKKYYNANLYYKPYNLWRNV